MSHVFTTDENNVAAVMEFRDDLVTLLKTYRDDQAAMARAPIMVRDITVTAKRR